ncbi:putative haloalkane dehalogenase [Dioscorea sansibarensis]
MALQSNIFSTWPLPRALPVSIIPSKPLHVRCGSSVDGQEKYLIDAPMSAGDGFSFTGGKYSDGPSRSEEWFAQGKFLKAHPLRSSRGKAKDPIFGLKMGAESQSSDDVFRWFCVEAGNSSNPRVILIHGFPSQAYSFREVLRVLSEDYHAVAFDWLGFGFSDKPQPKYGFDYTLDEYVSALESLVEKLAVDKFSLVVQDPLRASDKTLTSSGPYMMKEEDAMVYRRPYLTSGSSGFALNAISRAMKKDLRNYVEEMKKVLISETWTIPTTVCWGMRDCWLSYDGVADFCKISNSKLVELPMAGHHVQEDYGEELANIISQAISKGK